jgi:hypothetical protein
MQNSLARVRYWLEMIALPAFVFLVIHLSGHAVMSFFGEDEHLHEESTASFLEKIFNTEVGVGILFLILFVWIWHRPQFKKWVPCRHDHCHAEKQMPHLLAILAFCLHFFPEAGVRHALINQAMGGEISSIVGVVAFGAHFLLDILVMGMLAMYWETRNKQILSLLLMVGMWFGAFFFGENISFELAPSDQGGLFLFSAFLLAMFVHKPHRPKKQCGGCCEH